MKIELDLGGGNSVLVVYPDPALHAPYCPGWHVVYTPTPPEWGDLVIDPAGLLTEFRAEACDDLEACWVRVDYCVDEELGEPVAIWLDDDIKYQLVNGTWVCLDCSLPPVSRWRPQNAQN